MLETNFFSFKIKNKVHEWAGLGHELHIIISTDPCGTDGYAHQTSLSSTTLHSPSCIRSGLCFRLWPAAITGEAIVTFRAGQLKATVSSHFSSLKRHQPWRPRGINGTAK